MNYGGGGYEAYGNDDFGGGGFMDGASQGGGMGSQGTPSKRGGGGRGNRDAQTLLPVTIKQLLAKDNSVSDDVFRVDGQEVSNVKVLGILSNVVPHSTNVNFQLDDGTGIIDGRLFVHADDTDYVEAEIAKLRDGIYVRAVGNLRTFQDKVSLGCFTVSPIEDFNEVTHHFLDAIYVHCFNTKGPLQSASSASAGTPMKNEGFQMTGQPTWNQGGNTGASSSYLGHSGAGGMAMDYGMMDSNFSPEQKAILDVLGTCMSDRGMKIDQIFTDLRGQMTEDQLRSALNYLTSEGHVYSTIDENHFKRTA